MSRSAALIKFLQTVINDRRIELQLPVKDFTKQAIQREGVTRPVYEPPAEASALMTKKELTKWRSAERKKKKRENAKQARRNEARVITSLGNEVAVLDAMIREKNKKVESTSKGKEDCIKSAEKREYVKSIVKTESVAMEKESVETLVTKNNVVTLSLALDNKKLETFGQTELASETKAAEFVDGGANPDEPVFVADDELIARTEVIFFNEGMDFSSALSNIGHDFDEHISNIVDIMTRSGLVVADDFSAIGEVGTLDVAAVDDMIITREVDPSFELPWKMGI